MVEEIQESEEDQWKENCVEVVLGYLRKKYLSDRYYDDKIKEFHELKLGQQTMEEYENKFLELLRYVR